MIRRTAPRHSVLLPVAFSGDREGMGIIHNLSVNGCRIASSSTGVEAGQYLSLLLHPGDHEPPITVEVAEVRWVNPLGFGVAFRTFDAEEQDRLLLFINNLPSA